MGLSFVEGSTGVLGSGNKGMAASGTNVGDVGSGLAGSAGSAVAAGGTMAGGSAGLIRSLATSSERAWRAASINFDAAANASSLSA